MKNLLTISDYKYLMAVKQLSKNQPIRQTDVAIMLNVTRVSVFNGIEKLINYNYIKRSSKKIMLTDDGYNILSDYEDVINKIQKFLYSKSVLEETSWQDAMVIACSISEESFLKILNSDNN